MQEAADLIALRAAARAVRGRFPTASDDELLADLALVEEIGNIVDGLRVAGAAQAEFRSRRILGEQSLAFRRGARDGVELVQLTARVSGWEAKRRVGLGTAIAPVMALSGEVVPGRHPLIAEAVESGEIGVEAARVIVNLWKSVHLAPTTTPWRRRSRR